MSRKPARPTDEGDQEASFGEVKGESEKDEEDSGEYFDGGGHDKESFLTSIEMAISLLNEPISWPTSDNQSSFSAFP